MPARAFRLPGDLETMLDVLPRAFQYPENESWNVQSDEMEDIQETARTIRRLWPLLAVLQPFVPAIRDAMRGYVWEEGGQPIGLCNVIRQNETDTWLIGNVAVLPEYRRRGIARQLVEACLDYARQRGAQRIILDVIAGNLPAYALYESLGFTHFSGYVMLDYPADRAAPSPPPLPQGFAVTPLPRNSWRPRYELDRRITPADVQRFDPVLEDAYRTPAVLRVLSRLIMAMTGRQARRYEIGQATNPGGNAHAEKGGVLALAAISARTRAGGVNRIAINLDPACAGLLAEALTTRILHETLTIGPGRRVEYQLPQWQPALIEAALNAGFVQLFEYHRMGIQLA